MVPGPMFTKSAFRTRRRYVFNLLQILACMPHTRRESSARWAWLRIVIHPCMPVLEPLMAFLTIIVVDRHVIHHQCWAPGCYPAEPRTGMTKSPHALMALTWGRHPYPSSLKAVVARNDVVGGAAVVGQP